MSQIQMDNVSGQPWVYPITLTTNSHNVVFETAGKFVDRNIKAEIGVAAGSVSPIFTNTNLGTYFNAGTAESNSISISPKATTTAGFIAEYNSTSPVTGTTAYYSIKTANPNFDGGTLSGGSTATGTNVTLGNSNNGIKIQTVYTANRTAILYNGAVNGWVSRADNAQALGSDSLASTNGTAYYITAITVPKNIPFSVTTTTDGDGEDSTSTLSITNNAGRRIEVTNAGSIYARQTTSGKGNVFVKAYGDSTDTQIVNNGVWVTPTVNAAGTYYGKVVVSAGSVTAPSSISGSSATLSAGTNTLTFTKTISVTPTVTTAGYIASGTAGNSSVSLTANVTTKAAATYYPKDTAQEIAASQYLTGKQTIAAVTYSNINAANIKYNVIVKVGDSADDDRIIGVTGTFTSASTVSSGQTAAQAAQIRKGYSAWVNGTEVKGSLGNTSVVQTNTTTVSSGTATRATATWGAGVITAGSIPAAIFDNKVATGKNDDNYIDISNTGDAPVLSAGGYLYINRGYTDDLKISLAHLIPDATGVNATADYILSGYTAYNNDGQLIQGNIATYQGYYEVV